LADIRSSFSGTIIASAVFFNPDICQHSAKIKDCHATLLDFSTVFLVTLGQDIFYIQQNLTIFYYVAIESFDEKKFAGLIIDAL